MPALVELAGEMVVWFAWLVLFGLLYAYRYSLGALIGHLADLLGSWRLHIPGVIDAHPLAFLANALHAFDNYVQGAIEDGITWSERAGIVMLQGVADLAAWAAYETEQVAFDTLGAFKRIGDVHIPNLRKWVKGFVAGAIAIAVTKLHKFVHALLKPITTRIGHLAHRITVAERAIEHWTGYTAKQLRALLRRLSKLNYLAAYAGIAALGGAMLKKLDLAWLKQYANAAALVGAALATLGLGWLRCERVGRTGNNLCGMDSDLLDLLLLETLGIVGAISLVEFTHDVQDITGVSVGIMRGFIREF